MFNTNYEYSISHILDGCSRDKCLLFHTISECPQYACLFPGYLNFRAMKWACGRIKEVEIIFFQRFFLGFSMVDKYRPDTFA